MDKILERVRNYFATTSRAQIEKDWAKTEEWDNCGPTIEEVLSSHQFIVNVKIETNSSEPPLSSEKFKTTEKPEFNSGFFYYI